MGPLRVPPRAPGGPVAAAAAISIIDTAGLTFPAAKVIAASCEATELRLSERGPL